MLIKDIILPGLRSISVNATMIEAKKKMGEANIRHLPIYDGETIVGIISDKDVERATSVISSSGEAQKFINENKKVSEYMTSPVIKMKNTDTIEELVREMITRKLSSFIIEDEQKKPVGIITTEDLLILLLDCLQSQKPVMKKLKKIFTR